MKVQKASHLDQTDKADLRKLLSNPKVTKNLQQLTDLAYNASKWPRKDDCYVPVTPAFCDGFEILVHDTPRHVVEHGETVLLDAI